MWFFSCKSSIVSINNHKTKIRDRRYEIKAKNQRFMVNEMIPTTNKLSTFLQIYKEKLNNHPYNYLIFINRRNMSSFWQLSSYLSVKR